MKAPSFLLLCNTFCIYCRYYLCYNQVFFLLFYILLFYILLLNLLFFPFFLATIFRVFRLWINSGFDKILDFLVFTAITWKRAQFEFCYGLMSSFFLYLEFELCLHVQELSSEHVFWNFAASNLLRSWAFCICTSSKQNTHSGIRIVREYLVKILNSLIAFSTEAARFQASEKFYQMQLCFVVIIFQDFFCIIIESF